MGLSKEVKRYVIGNNGLPEFSESGEFVAYGDYDALLAERNAIVAKLEYMQKDAARFAYIERDADGGMRNIYGDDWIAVIDQSIAEGC